MSEKTSGEKRITATDQRCAGGVVICSRACGALLVLLVCVDRGDGRIEWVLPKGHVEEGESIEDAARREIEEETGIDAGELSLVEKVGEISYSFAGSSAERIDKTVTFFLFKVETELLMPLSRLPLLIGSCDGTEGIIESGFYAVDFAREMVSFRNYVTIIDQAVRMLGSNTTPSIPETP